MDPSDLSVQPVPSSTENNDVESRATESSHPMDEFYQLKQELLTSTLILTGLCLIPVWWCYSLHIALNYFIGACAGMLYLGLLARNVERLGPQRSQVGKSQIAVFIGVIVLATQWEQLQVLPVFLGFLMYKAAVLVYTLRTAVLPRSNTRA